MLQSSYIFNIVELLLEDFEFMRQAKKQLDYINEKDFEYTGSGLLVGFEHLNGIQEHKINTPDLILNGVKIESSEYSIKAETNLFFTDGLIDYLEIWCYLGDYPHEEMIRYKLSQVWENRPQRVICIGD